MANHSDTYETSETVISQNVLPYGSRTDVGYVRDHNEDNLLVAPPLFVVCDGMGGHEAGEVASKIAVDTIARTAPNKLDADALGHSVEEANLAIIDAAQKGFGRDGMGTTCTAAILDGTRLAVAQVGDSRAYLLHNGSLQQITRDHSVVADLVESGEITPEEARTHQWRSYITRALGLEPQTRPDLYEIEVEQGDRLMLCSDGLYSMVPDSVIEEVLATTETSQDACELLVEAALSAGGSDNITVIVTDVTGFNMQKSRKAARRSKLTAVAIVMLMVLIIGGAALGFSVLVNTSAYLGEVDGNVAIYKGMPGDLFGISTSSLEEVTDVPLDGLQPGVAERIRNLDIRCDSLEDAQGLVADYKYQIARQDAENLTPSSQDASTQDPSAQDPAAQGAATQAPSGSTPASPNRANTSAPSPASGTKADQG